MAKSTAPPFRGLPRAARAYVLAVLFAVPPALFGATHIAHQPELEVALLVATVVLCAGGNLFEVFAPGHYSFQPNLVFFFWAAVLLPPWAVPLVAVASYLPGWVAHRFRWYMVAFNIADYALAGLLVNTVVRAAHAAVDTDVGAAAVLFASALAFVAINHLLIVAVISFSRHAPLSSCLKETAGGLPLDAALALTGACLAVLWIRAPVFAVLAAGPMMLIYRALWVPLLRHKSRTDPKTGLFNSEHLEAELGDAVADAAKRRSVLAVVMIDLDHLRAVNNRCGHLAGDQLIRAVAAIMADVAGHHGVAARFGGEEFCLVLPNASLAQALSAAEDVRRQVEQIRLSTDDGSGTVSATISAGVAVYPEHGQTAETLLGAADAAVYDAKLGGRNRVRAALGAGADRVLEPPSSPSIADVPTPERAADRTPVPELEPEHAPAPPPARTHAESADAAAPAAPGRHRKLIPWYAAILCAGAALAGGLSSPDRIADEPLVFGLLLAAVLIADIVRIDVFERANVSPAAIPIIALAFLYGPLGPIAAELAIAVGRAGRREPVIKWTFDFGALALAGVATAVFTDAIGSVGNGTILIVGAAAGVIYYIASSVLVAGVISLNDGRRLISAWREDFAWLWPHYVAFGTLAATLVVAEEALGAYVFVIFGVPTAMLWLAQQQYVQRSRSSVTALRDSHAELEDANLQLRELLGDNETLLARMHRSYLSTITSLARTIEAKDPYTGGHTERVARLAVMLAGELGFDEAGLRAVEVGAVIHDIGKIGVADSILLKQGRLDAAEMNEIRRHPEIASYIVAELDLPPIVKQMVRSHHERFDGSGYPDALAGEEIPLAPRILSVADALDAMTSDRPYRAAMSLDQAWQEIQAESGSQFCPRVVAALSVCLERDRTFWAAYEASARGAEPLAETAAS